MSSPVEIVTEFLRLVEARQLDAASGYLDEDVLITFPGGRTFSNLNDQVLSSKGRFRTISKVFERFDVTESEGDSVVYVFGTLEGVASDGTTFTGVRFIDRFLIRDGLITDQKVWNDFAERGLLPPQDRS